MATSWSTLLGGKTSAQVFDEIIAGLKGLTPPFPVDDWSEGAVVRVILKTALAPALSLLWGAVSDTTKGGFLRLAQAVAESDPVEWEANSDGSWLVLLARQKYLVEPHPAAFAEGTIRFVNNSGVAYTINPGQFVASTDTGLKYRNVNGAPIPLPAGATIYVPFKAESPGESYNVNGGTIKVLNVSLPGVTISNEPQPPSTTWITTYGSRKETPRELADRCAARWGRISKLQTHPRDGYVSFARDAAPQVKRTAVFSNYLDGIARPGTVTMYLAGDTGGVAPAVVDTVSTALAPYRGINEDIFVLSAQPFTIKLEGKVWSFPGYQITSVKAAVEQELLALQRALPIGGTIYAWQILAAFRVAGVEDVKLKSIADTTLARNQVVIFDYSALEYGTLT